MAANFRGFSLTDPPNRIPAGRVGIAQNVRAYAKGSVMPRNLETDTIDMPYSASVSPVPVCTSATWTNPVGAIASTQAGGAGTTSSGNLVCTVSGLLIPAGATINGVRAGFSCNSIAIYPPWTPTLQLSGYFQYGATSSTTVLLDLPEGALQIGSPSDTLGVALTPAMLNTGFTLNLSMLGSGLIVSLWNLTITVYYTNVGALQFPSSPYSISRLNDSTPNGPASGYSLVIGAAGNLYVNSLPVATGLSGNPLSLVPFRPNTSVQPWMYVGDSSESVEIPSSTPVSYNPAPTMSATLWSNPANARSTSLYATTTGNYNALNATVGALSLPAGAVIVGVKVLWKGFSTGSGGATTVTMLVSSVPGSQFIPTWPTTVGSMSYGSRSTMWGFTSAQIASGFVIRVVGPYYNSTSLNSLVIGVYYAVPFAATGMLKVRSDGLCYKMGIEEPQLAPVVGTQNTTVSVLGNLAATDVPWTNYLGQNTNYNYGQTTQPNPSGPITPPFIINCANASTITITSLTGTATINGGSKTPTSAGPSTASTTNPGHYVMAKGTGVTPPASASVVIGAFTDGAGNVIAAGQAPLYIPSVWDVGGNIGTAIPVPFGAQQFQVGINSTSNTFSANSGSFSLAVTVTTNALPAVTSILGNLTLYYWDDSPTKGSTSAYIWKNPEDSGGSGPTRSISDALGSTTGNSFIFDATFNYAGSMPPPHTGPGIPGLPGIGTESVSMQWFSLTPESVVAGSNAVFASPLTKTDPTNKLYDNFNFCLTGSIYFPSGGNFTFNILNHDDFIWGIGGGVTLVSATSTFDGNPTTPALSTFGQTKTVVGGYPLLPRGPYPSGEGGEYAAASATVHVSAAGIYPIEADYNYWFNTGRIFLINASPTAGATPTIIPPLPATVRQQTQYRYVYRSSATGAMSNPSPESTAESIPVTSNTITSLWSDDPQVDVVDYYRIDSVTLDFTYVNTGPNDDLGGGGTNTPVTDSLTDTQLGTQLLQFDNYEPFPSIDLPQKGTCNVSGGVITWLTGGAIGGAATGFNPRWLAGTLILIGSPTSLAYTLIARPVSNTITIPGVPDGTNLAYEIEEPILAAQPLAYLFGPTDNINFVFGVGDPLRPGTLYWSKGSNLDSAPDTNQMDVTDPSEPLVNGAMSGGRGVVFSIKRAWAIMPNFFNALATATGTVGSTWTLQATSINRGLFMPRCLAVEGGGAIFFRVDDGIHVSPGGAESKSITDEDLYPLFSHEGSVPQAVTREGVTIYPPDDTQPEAQQFSIVNGYLYYDYMDTTSVPRTLVFDIAAMGWIWDVYEYPVTVHAPSEGESQQGVLVGCNDGSIRLLSSTGDETSTAIILTAAIGGKGWQHCGQTVVEYAASAPITLTLYPADADNGSYGPAAVTLPSTGGALTKYFFRFGANKWKLAWFLFSSTNRFTVNCEGCLACTKFWGSTGPYVPVPMFGEAGGEG